MFEQSKILNYAEFTDCGHPPDIHCSVCRPAPAKPTQLEAGTRAQFDSNMIMIRHMVTYANAEQARYYYRTLKEQCRFLERALEKNR